MSSNVDRHNLTVQAQDQISAILKKLEKDTGRTVDYIEIRTLDVSTVSIDKLMRIVRIAMHSNPGEDWG